MVSTLGVVLLSDIHGLIHFAGIHLVPESVAHAHFLPEIISRKGPFQSPVIASFTRTKMGTFKPYKQSPRLLPGITAGSISHSAAKDK